MKPTRIVRRTLGIVGVVAGTACGAGAPEAPAGIASEPFGTVDGQPVRVYTLRNRNGVEARVTNYGGIILSLKVPDRAGRPGDVVLGFDSLESYETESPYFGALIGRYGNRIANGRFTLDGHTYTLATNDGSNHLHGGLKGFDKRVWAAEPFDSGGVRGLVLRYTSPDGEEGYPGTLVATVTYTLTDGDALVFDYRATTDRPTPVNLTQHTYFNLAGPGTRDVLGHIVTIDADRFTPVDSILIPTGELRDVAGTPFDFRRPTAIGARIGDDDRQLHLGRGYDHNFVLNRPAEATGSTFAARVYEPTTGRQMDVLTTEPGLQFYTGNFLDGSVRGKGGVVYGHRHGFAMETEHFPDSPNHPAFPSAILRPGEEYRSTTIYRFSTRN